MIDVVIGNPPYQVEKNSKTRFSIPIYNVFIENAFEKSKGFVSMIIPARWYNGGVGLKKFKSNMFDIYNLKALYDFPYSKDIFQSVDISGGICYFLIDSINDKDDKSNFKYVSNGNLSERNASGDLIFIRNVLSESIIKKIKNYSTPLSKYVMTLNYFNVTSKNKDDKEGVKCRMKNSIGSIFVKENKFRDPINIINKWKVVVPKAPISGQTNLNKKIRLYHKDNVLVLKDGNICSETWIVLNHFDTEIEANNFKKYVLTKTFIFLVLQTMSSQNTSRLNFSFIPSFKKYGNISDEKLYKLFKLNVDEIEHIEKSIRSMD